MIADAGGGTNAMDVSKNVRAWRCKRCPARLQACCPGGGLLLLVAWSTQVNTLPKAKSQAKDKRAKDRQKYAALRYKVGVFAGGLVLKTCER
jgi:hypothetical protein